MVGNDGVCLLYVHGLSSVDVPMQRHALTKYSGLEMCWCMSACSMRASPPSSQDMSGTIDALIGHLQDMGRLDAVNLMQIAVKEYGGSDSTSANSGPMLGG